MTGPYREAVEPGGPPDLRAAVQVAADAAAIVAELRQAFLASDEVASLRQAYHAEVGVRLTISSSRKYTRFEFPNCPRLHFKFEKVLERHRCVLHRGTPYDTTFVLTIPRLGCPDETIDWIRCAPASSGEAACTCPSGDGSLRWPCPTHPTGGKFNG